MKKQILASLATLSLLTVFGAVSAFSYPSQVKGVRVVPVGETGLQLSWEEATSAEDIIIGYRVYYGLTSVQDKNAAYDDDVFVSGSRTVTLQNLTSGIEYFIAVTALDSEENESEQYSVEKSVMTQGEAPVEEEIIPLEPEVIEEPEVVTEPEVIVDPNEFLEPEVIIEPEITEPEIVEEPFVIEEPIVIEEPEVFGPEVPEYLRPAAPDVVAPIEAMDLRADTARISDDSIAVLSWAKSLNVDGDVTDQILYVRKNMSSWDNGYSIGADLVTLELDVERGTIYEYKIVTLDGAGNEAESAIYSFSTELTQSGPAGFMGIAVAIFVLFGLGMIAARRQS